jgi:hypothetical protein
MNITFAPDFFSRRFKTHSEYVHEDTLPGPYVPIGIFFINEMPYFLLYCETTRRVLFSEVTVLFCCG